MVHENKSQQTSATKIHL